MQIVSTGLGVGVGARVRVRMSECFHRRQHLCGGRWHNVWECVRVHVPTAGRCSGCVFVCVCVLLVDVSSSFV